MDSVARKLVDQGHEVTYVRFDDGCHQGYLNVPDGVKAFDIEVPPKKHPWQIFKQEKRFSLELRSWIGLNRPDIIHTNFCLPGNVARRVAKQAGVSRVVTTCHELFGSMNPYFRLTTRRTQRYCDCLVYISKTVAASYGVAEDKLILSDEKSECQDTPDEKKSTNQPGRSPKRLRGNFLSVVDKHQLIYNGIDIQRIASYAALASDVVPYQLISVGRLVPEKGHALILRALPALIGQFPKTRLVLVGEGPERHRLESLAQKLGVADRIDFRGWVPQAEAIAEMARSHAVVLPSRAVQEGFGLALAEAMLTGRPVIASDIPVFREVAADCGVVYFKDDDPRQIFTAIARILTLEITPAHGSDDATKRVDRVVANFDSRRMADAYLSIYQRILDSNQ